MRTHLIPEPAFPSIGTERTFASVWREYRAESTKIFRHSSLPIIPRALINAAARLKLRHVRHVTFEQLTSTGHNIQTFNDGAEPLKPEKLALRSLPEKWNVPQPVIVPKIATLRGAVLFIDGSALLPDGRYCYFDTNFCGSGNWYQPRDFDQRSRIFFYADPVTDSALIRRHLRCIDVPGRCFSTRGRNFWNFGHFVHDELSRIYYEDLGAIVPGRDRVIAPRMHSPMQEALFRKVFADYEIVQVPPHVPLRVEELLLPANLCKHDKFNPAAIAQLARRMRKILRPYAGKDLNKVCVSRKDGKKTLGRDFVNAEAYEALMSKLGYRVQTVSELDSNAQFALWANTTDIVGIHGAGMMNMIMMPSEGNYTEIVGARTSSTPRCAMAAGHRVGVLASVRDIQGRSHIDLDRLEALLLGQV